MFPARRRASKLVGKRWQFSLSGRQGNTAVQSQPKTAEAGMQFVVNWAVQFGCRWSKSLPCLIPDDLNKLRKRVAAFGPPGFIGGQVSSDGVRTRRRPCRTEVLPPPR